MTIHAELLPARPDMANSKTKPPYVEFPKALYDAFLASPMPPVHKAVVLAVIRRTIGHYKGTRPHDASPVSVAMLAGMTGHHRTAVSKARRDLVKNGVLVVVEEATWYDAAILYVNPDPTQWGTYSVNPAVVCWEAVESGYPQTTTKQAVESGEGGSPKQPEGAVDYCPLKSEEFLEEKKGAAPDDDLEGSSGFGLDPAIEEALRARGEQQADLSGLSSNVRIGWVNRVG